MTEGLTPGQISDKMLVGTPEKGKSQKIYLFAITEQRVIRNKGPVTMQGRCYSAAPAQPTISEVTHYVMLVEESYGDNGKHKGQPKNIQLNVKDSVEELAWGIACLRYQGNPYPLEFLPTEEQINSLKEPASGVRRIVRSFSPEEQEVFMIAFQKATQTLSKREGIIKSES